MFLDYDGTLTPIVNDPDQAVMSEEVRQRGQIGCSSPSSCLLPSPSVALCNAC